jgi:hypothetical protein
MFRLTDDTGILQHAIFSVPNTCEGYTTDDNARALIVSTLVVESPSNAAGNRFANLSHRYLAFLWLAFNSGTGRFRNFLGYDRRWLEEVGSDDSHGRALWALGTVLGGSSKLQFPRRSHLAVPAHGRIAFLACRPTWTGSLGTGPFRAPEMH